MCDFYKLFDKCLHKMFALFFVALFVTPALAEWQMFSDGVDTYLFNTQSGDVYVRFRKGGKNYEDVFVKMPAGVRPNKQTKQPPTKSQNPPPNPNNETTQALEAIKKSQEIMNKSLDSSGIEAGF